MLLKQITKDSNILQQKRKAPLVEVLQSIIPTNNAGGKFLLLEEANQEPEWFFLVTTRDHHDEGYHEVHALSVPDILIVNRVRLENVFKLSETFRLQLGIEKVIQSWESSRFIFWDIVKCITVGFLIFPKIEKLFVQTLGFWSQLRGNEFPGNPPVLWWGPRC